MKKAIIGIVLGILLIVGGYFLITNFKTPSLEFKKDYESVNGKENSQGKLHREVNVDEKNPYVTVTTKEILKMIDNKETFFVYFGDKLCPWCRSVIEKSIEVANKLSVKKIYYVEIWDDEVNEIVRDKYVLEDGKPVKTVEGTEDYKKLLELFDSVLSDYNLTDENGNKVPTGEKRIYAPNYFYIKNGVVDSMVEGISSLQKDPREELTEEMLKEEENIFTEFFNKKNVCTKEKC